MKLFVLTDPQYSETDTGAGFMFVVRAVGEQAARALVVKAERRKRWARADLTDCEELTAEGDPEIIGSAHVNP